MDRPDDKTKKVFSVVATPNTEKWNYYDWGNVTLKWLIVAAAITVIFVGLLLTVLIIFWIIPLLNKSNEKLDEGGETMWLLRAVLDPSIAARGYMGRGELSIEDRFSAVSTMHRFYDLLGLLDDYEVIQRVGEVAPYVSSFAQNNNTKPALLAIGAITERVGAIFKDGRAEAGVLWLADQYEDMVEFAKTHGGEEMAEMIKDLRPQIEAAANETAKAAETVFKTLTSTEVKHISYIAYKFFERMTENERIAKIEDAIPEIAFYTLASVKQVYNSDIFNKISGVPDIFKSFGEKIQIFGHALQAGVGSFVDTLPKQDAETVQYPNFRD